MLDEPSFTITFKTRPLILNGGKPFVVEWASDSPYTGSFKISDDDWVEFVALGSFDLTK